MTETGAAHIITSDASALGKPEIIVMTRDDEGAGAHVIETMNIPAEHAANLDEILRGLGMWSWRTTGELQPTDHDGYWIVDVERTS